MIFSSSSSSSSATNYLPFSWMNNEDLWWTRCVNLTEIIFLPYNGHTPGRQSFNQTFFSFSNCPTIVHYLHLRNFLFVFIVELYLRSLMGLFNGWEQVRRNYQRSGWKEFQFTLTKIWEQGKLFLLILFSSETRDEEEHFDLLVWGWRLKVWLRFLLDWRSTVDETYFISKEHQPSHVQWWILWISDNSKNLVSKGRIWWSDLCVDWTFLSFLKSTELFWCLTAP